LTGDAPSGLRRWLGPVALALLLLLAALPLVAAPTFPKLTGRVVDEAQQLNASVRSRLSERLAAHERATGNQVVVVTLENLSGYSIEEYAYQLGRHWGIGQKGGDNGVLLIICPSERSLRIEVGYGLEGVLTDAISSNIINGVIVPYFRSGQVEAGIEAGAISVVEALGGQYEMRARSSSRSAPRGRPSGFLVFIIVLFVLGSSFRGGRRRGRGLGRAGWLLGGFALGSTLGRGGGGFGGGGFGGGGFGGGGGSFGGGGASGGW
jgi:uncharacterized protein